MSLVAALLAAHTFAALDRGAGPAEPAADALGAAWRARAELATRRLTGKGLDACDLGLERAFQSPEVQQKGDERQVMLAIVVDGAELVVSWSYKGQKLQDFGIVRLPPRVFARQVAGERTLTFLAGGKSRCALDLCPDDPLSGGPCPGEKR